MNQHFIYVLKCNDNSYYCGYTTNVNRRVNEHNSDNKKGAKYTKYKRPVKLIYSESYKTKSEALKREHAIKNLTRLEKEQLVKSSY